MSKEADASRESVLQFESVSGHYLLSGWSLFEGEDDYLICTLYTVFE